jgi:hypothetical protein
MLAQRVIALEGLNQQMVVCVYVRFPKITVAWPDRLLPIRCFVNKKCDILLLFKDETVMFRIYEEID